jgi:hypothetical protein
MTRSVTSRMYLVKRHLCLTRQRDLRLLRAETMTPSSASPDMETPHSSQLHADYMHNEHGEGTRTTLAASETMLCFLGVLAWVVCKARPERGEASKPAVGTDHSKCRCSGVDLPRAPSEKLIETPTWNSVLADLHLSNHRSCLGTTLLHRNHIPSKTFSRVPAVMAVQYIISKCAFPSRHPWIQRLTCADVSTLSLPYQSVSPLPLHV